MKNHCTASLRSGVPPLLDAICGDQASFWPLDRAASVRFRSGVYFHHGFAGSPAMNRTAAMNTSITHGSWRTPVAWHKPSYSLYEYCPQQVVRGQDADQSQIGRNRRADVGNLLQVSDFGPADGLHHRSQFMHIDAQLQHGRQRHPNQIRHNSPTQQGNYQAQQDTSNDQP